MALTYRNRDVFKTLSEAGINYIRLRAWNNPDRECSQKHLVSWRLTSRFRETYLCGLRL